MATQICAALISINPGLSHHRSDNSDVIALYIQVPAHERSRPADSYRTYLQQAIEAAIDVDAIVINAEGGESQTEYLIPVCHAGNKSDPSPLNTCKVPNNNGKVSRNRSENSLEDVERTLHGGSRVLRMDNPKRIPR